MDEIIHRQDLELLLTSYSNQIKSNEILLTKHEKLTDAQIQIIKGHESILNKLIEHQNESVKSFASLKNILVGLYAGTTIIIISLVTLLWSIIGK